MFFRGSVRTLACAMIAIIAGVHLGGAAQDLVPLTAAHDIVRTIARDESHRYGIVLAADERIDVDVEQRGVDVVIDLLAPDGTPLAEFQDEVRNQGEEHVEVIGSGPGTYTLVVKPAEGVIVADGASYAMRMTGRHPTSDTDRAMYASRKLRAAALQLRSQGKFADERPLLAQAVRLAEHLPQPNDTYLALLLTDLAGAALESHDNAEASAVYTRALTLLEKIFGPDHPQTAIVRSRLALTYQRDENYVEATRLLEPSVAALEQTVGPEHPWFLRSLVTLGNLRADLGDLDRAEAIDLRAIAILEKQQQADSIVYADLLNNVALVYQQKRDYVRAEDYLQRSMAIGERIRGPESYYVSTALQNLGVLARLRKDQTAAEQYYTRALQIRERLVGPDHPDVAQLLNNLGNVYQSKGDTPRALAMHGRALRIRENAPYQPSLLASLANIARIYAATGDVAQALTFQRRADAVVERQLAANLVIGSERQKLALAGSMRQRTDRTLSLHLQLAPDDADAASLATLVLLQRKGRVLDAMTDTFAAVRQRLADPGDRDLLDQLRRTASDLARVSLSAPDRNAPKETPDEHHQRVAALEARKEQLEADLSRRSETFRAQMQPVSLDAVQAVLPDDAALVELAVFRPFDPNVDGDEAFGPPHYAAYVVRKHGVPRGRDLGPIAPIAEAVASLRQALRDPLNADVKRRARAVDALIMQPLRGAIGGAARLLISPDGDLNLVPFEALMDERGRYLVERYAVTYLTSGRDLLRMQATQPSAGAPVIVADPLFGEPGPAGLTSPAPASPGAPGRRGAMARTSRRALAGGDDGSTMYFAPLGATAAEARAIKTLFPDATLFTGRQATKSTLQHLDAPRILHIASHGFFLQESGDIASSAAASSSSSGRTRASANAVRVDNPLLRSGLALAGANLSRDLQGDGILTALEASGLNLWGTKLVTLSACDTGVGEVRNGEGVYGMRRAFVLAGAETLVMSLWPVSDYVTRETMTSFYTGLRAGLGRGDALRQAKLKMLKRPGRQHPFYWASFIESGEWANLDGRR